MTATNGWVVLVAGLEHVAVGSLDRVGGVVGAHELGKRGCSNKSANKADTFNETANGSSIVLGSGFDTRLSLGDDEAPNGNRNSAEGLTIGA